MAEKAPVPRLKNGLIDLTSLHVYLHPNTDAVPLKAPPGWKYHHVWHKKKKWLQLDKPKAERDQRMIDFRGSPYHQFLLRIKMEQAYHEAHEEDIDPPKDDEVIVGSLRDLRRLDVLGASVAGLALARGNRGGSRVDHTYAPPLAIQAISPKERADFFTEKKLEAVRSLDDIEFTSQRLVTSAIKRLSIRLADPSLAELANGRLSEDPIYYPVKVPSRQDLLVKSNNLLLNAILQPVELKEAA